MSNRHTFHPRIEEAGGGAAFVRIPREVEAALGKKRVLVNAWIDGEQYRGTLVRMGTPCQILIILKEIREKIGKGAGDEVEIITERAYQVVETFAGLIHEQKRAGIMVTHDLRMCEYVDRILQMRDGKLVKIYSTREEIMNLAWGTRE